ncbi:MAG: 30S ribosomal protein S9 [Bdellovibrionales bacterium]|nr:30S ribosomal protein S9 [Bdellovibrionales bacterium]
MATDFVQATGRRKTAKARVRLYPGGDGQIQINKRAFEDYFPVDTQRRMVARPLLLTEKQKSMNVQVTVDGGGVNGQAGAVAHGIARALMKVDPELRGILKKEGLVTRDPRMKERKKYGQPGARKRFQYSKR